MEKEKVDYIFKLIIIGNSSTGKSCLLHYFIENQIRKATTHTVGVEFGSKTIQIGSKNIKLQIWDTAGQERFRSVARSYYRGAFGAIILYDITNSDSFAATTQWLKDARELAKPDIACILIGNKSDLKEDREVLTQNAERFAKENGLTFLETSAVTGENAQEAFETLAKTILDKIEGGIIDSTDALPKKPGVSSSSVTPSKGNNNSRCGACS